MPKCPICLQECDYLPPRGDFEHAHNIRIECKTCGNFHATFEVYQVFGVPDQLASHRRQLSAAIRKKSDQGEEILITEGEVDFPQAISLTKLFESYIEPSIDEKMTNILSFLSKRSANIFGKHIAVKKEDYAAVGASGAMELALLLIELQNQGYLTQRRTSQGWYVTLSHAGHKAVSQVQKSSDQKREQNLTDLGKKIHLTILEINRIYKSIHGIDLFTPTTESALFFANFPEQANSEEAFKMFISNLYMAIYEGSGDLKRVPEIIKNDFLFIKSLRRHFHHDLNHGDQTSSAKKFKDAGDVLEKFSGKRSVQQFLVRDFNNASESILKHLSDLLLKLKDSLS